MTAQNTLSPSLMNVLVAQLAEGKVKAHNLQSSVKANTPISYGDRSASFVKDAPGRYSVLLFKDGNQVGKEEAGSPLEAKMTVLDYIKQGTKQQS